jgi:hypothetical protein
MPAGNGFSGSTLVIMIIIMVIIIIKIENAIIPGSGWLKRGDGRCAGKQLK